MVNPTNTNNISAAVVAPQQEEANNTQENNNASLFNWNRIAQMVRDNLRLVGYAIAAAAVASAAGGSIAYAINNRNAQATGQTNAQEPVDDTAQATGQTDAQAPVSGGVQTTQAQMQTPVDHAVQRSRERALPMEPVQPIPSAPTLNALEIHNRRAAHICTYSIGSDDSESLSEKCDSYDAVFNAALADLDSLQEEEDKDMAIALAAALNEPEEISNASVAPVEDTSGDEDMAIALAAALNEEI